MGIRRIAGALGAEILGIDLSFEDLGEDTVRAIRHAWLERQVVFFRDQRLDAAAYMAFVRRVGRQVEYRARASRDPPRSSR